MTEQAVSPSVTERRQLNRLLNFHEIRYGSFYKNSQANVRFVKTVSVTVTLLL